MGPGALEKLGPLVLLEILLVYSYMTFENAKVAKNGKGIFFLKLNSQQTNFGTDINENEIQYCKSLEKNI